MFKQFLSYIYKWLIKIYGWKLKGSVPHDFKGVLALAPHTSNWDAFWGYIYMYAYCDKMPKYALYKKEAAIFPISYIYNMVGGIPIERKSKSGKKISSMEALKNKLKSLDKGVIVFCPEGTRKKTNRWKKGFYNLATETDTKILLAKMDYSKKIVQVGPIFKPSGNFNEDIKIMNEFFKGTQGKNPENFELHKID